MNHLMVISIEDAIKIMLFLIAMLTASLYTRNVWVMGITALSFAIVTAAWRMDLALPVGLGLTAVLFIGLIVRRAYKHNKKRFFLFVGLGIAIPVVPFVLYLFFH